MKYSYYYGKLKNNKILLTLLLIVILGFVLRLYHLGTQSLWLDELRTKAKTAYPLIQLVKIVHLSKHPPLYYILVKLWIKIFGISEFTLRFPSLIFSVLSIIFIFKLAKELFNEKVGLISAFLLSLWPYNINYAQMAKMYTMSWFLGILSFLFFYRFIKENKIRDLLSYVTITTISIYTMYLGFVYITIQNIIFFPFLNIKQSKRWLLGQLAVILLYLPWINRFLYLKRLNWGHKIDHYSEFIMNLFLSVTGTNMGKRSWIEFFLYCFLIISAVIWFKNIKNNKKIILDFSQSDCLLFSWIVVPIIIFHIIHFFFRPMLAERYLGLIHIPLIILLSKTINKYNLKVKCALLIFLSFSIFLNHLYPYYREDQRYQGQNWRALGVELDKRIGDNDLIVPLDSSLCLEYCSKKHKATLMGLPEFRRLDIDKLIYDSIFFVYPIHQLKLFKIPEIKGYKLEEHIRSYRVGFFRFRKL
jgi:4-amino-4-deoxy-L-arabinose transferase-like glycosyltransferase